MTSCWIVVENGLTGTENQCCGVADSLGLSSDIKRIELREPWKTLTPWMPWGLDHAFAGTPLLPPWPNLVLAGGRKAIAAARYIKKKSPDTFTVFLQNPRINPCHFDLVAAPAHDGLRGRNVVTTQGSPNMVSPALLAMAGSKFAPLLSHLPVPRIAVLIGGNSRTHKMTPAAIEKLGGQLKRLEESGWGLMITTSRRTPPECRSALEKLLPASDSIYFWDGSGDNPYHGFLAWADYILVTADSASMLSEAATTGKPVYMVTLPGKSARFDRLHDNLIQSGIIRKFEGKLESYDYTPLHDAAMVAEEIRKRMRTNWK